MLTIGHISDLHFCASRSKHGDDSRFSHSQQILKSLEEIINNSAPDILIATGDLTNYGDPDSFLQCKEWLTSWVGFGSDDGSGLNFSKEAIHTVPGNHDAWNTTKYNPKATMLIDRRQKSLDHYFQEFPDADLKDDGVSYKWYQQDNSGILLVFVDSCYWGDSESVATSVFGNIRIDKIAKGEFTEKQLEKVLEIHDLGIAGNLLDDKGGSIDRTHFAKGLKILVMHHYLFEPLHLKEDRLMTFLYSDNVFKNIALADFDILLCGHKHIGHADKHNYRDHLDDVSITRFKLNYLRRSLGVHSLPINITNIKGKRRGKGFTAIFSAILSAVRQDRPAFTNQEIIDACINNLQQICSTDNPKERKQLIKKMLSLAVQAPSEVTRQDLLELEKIFSRRFSTSIAKSLNKDASKVINKFHKLSSRPFIQIMAPSSAKKENHKVSKRGYNYISISKSDKGWTVTNQCHAYNNKTNKFEEKSRESFSFTRKINA